MVTSLPEYFQDKLSGNHCYGCGTENAHGLHIKSYWAAENKAVCHFTPQPFHTAAPTHFLNGGLIATIIDCHCICTAIAYAYQLQGREIGQGAAVWFVTGELSLSYKRPVGIDTEVVLEASVTTVTNSKATVVCKLKVNDIVCVEATLVAIAVSEEWMKAKG
ncbi:PaaI family thioesterase [Photobacterium chitinilyticum]|uniref:Acyl-coenzyme A thioesterase THEM4 n=1 Tax=Photobacterium chitinilyticum TaxID=2485123 RepID=A0A444JW26_9GAMM|nr:PaaI family thioesterase [Photobacterium chitinilyticum]RWX57275.1 PaaI family thioesterase [Photobacterium chitinilyticum]